MRGRVAVGVALALLVAAAGLRDWAVTQTAPAAVPGPLPRAAASADSAAPWSAAPAQVPTDEQLASASGSAAPEPVPAARGGAVWDLCGVGRLPMPPGASPGERPELPEHLGATPLAEARGKLLAVLLGGDARAQVVASHMRENTLAVQRDETAEAELARAGRDPVAVSWALARCLTEPCQQQALDRWVELEPDNAVPLLLRIGSRPRADETSLRPLWKARRAQAHWGVLSDTVRRAMPADLPGYVQMQLLSEAMVAEGAVLDVGHQTALALCKPAPAAGTERQAGCTALARLMVERSDTLLGVMMGLQVGEAAGLDPAYLRDKRAALEQLRAQFGRVEAEQPLSCEALRQAQQWVEAVAREGEIPALRAMRASSPYSATPPQSR